ncbi:hypothetical protein PHLCEN_2v4080, partial [Hermanssonia centrifuga]
VCFSGLGVIFASGNLPEAHRSFESQHQCNRFCQYFQVPTDYSSWPSNNIGEPELSPSTAQEGAEEGVGFRLGPAEWSSPS